MIANLTPGLHSVSSEIYQADPCPAPSLSSGIANILVSQSPAHAWLAHPRLNPNYQREADSRMDLGSIAHAMLLEDDVSQIVVVEADDWRTKAAREARDQAHADGKYAILAHKLVPVTEMVHTARHFVSTTELRGIFDTGKAEQSLFWREDDLWCRARPDLISDDQRIVLDYKTTTTAEPNAFGRQIGSMGYDCQAEFYSRGMRAIGADATFVFLAQEITAPYACSLVSLSNAYREIGQMKVESAIGTWGRCTRESRWPAYDSRICYIEPAAWQLSHMEEKW